MWKCCCVLVVVSLCGGNVVSLAEGDPSQLQKQKSKPIAPATRSFQFDYKFEASGLQGKTVRIWLPVAKTDPHQAIKFVSIAMPGEVHFTVETKYKNQLLYCEVPVPADGRVSGKVVYSVTRKEVVSATSADQISTASLKTFLAANRLVPLQGKPLKLLDQTTLPKEKLSRAEKLYQLVDEHVRYSKDGIGWGNGDAEWVCDSKFGNCTDFHSLFISLSRSQGIPARFEMGFPIPGDKPKGTIGGYHCWAHFHIENRGWIPVDISEADKHPEMKGYYFGKLTPSRVAFTTGRDLVLTPKQNAPPLNYFIYPHIEVDGKIVPKPQMKLHFGYRNIDQKP